MSSPQRFEELVGHGKSLASLQRAYAAGRGHHAYLFTGPPGVGKRTTARILAQSLLCEAGAVGAPCLRCAPCLRVAAGTHPDRIELLPEGEFIKIDAVRQLTHSFHFRPFEGGARVALIPEAERLTVEAANALLKALEEPPPGSSFLLTTGNPAQLLPTIVSRCQSVPLSALSADDVERVLRRNLTEADEHLEAAARYSGGSPGRAMTLLEEPVFRERRQIFGAADALLNGDLRAALPFGDWAELDGGSADKGRGKLGEQRARVRAVIEVLEVLVRDLMLLARGGSAARLVNRDAEGPLGALAAELTWPQLSDMLAALREAEEAVAGNVTPRLVLETLAVRAARSAGGRDRHRRIGP